MTYNSYSRENSTQQNYLFNSGSELERGLDLGWYNTLFRNYDPAIGRFIQVDPLADFFSGINPYSFAFNNPISYSDPDGLAPMWWLKLRANVKQIAYNLTGRKQYHAAIVGKHKGNSIVVQSGLSNWKTHKPTTNPRNEQVANTYAKNEPKDDPEPTPQPAPVITPNPEPAPDPVSQPEPKDDPIVPGTRIRFDHWPFNPNHDVIKNPDQTDEFLDPIAAQLKANPHLAVTIQIITTIPADKLSQQLKGIPGKTGSQMMWNRGLAIQNALLKMGVDSSQVVFMYKTGAASGPGRINLIFRGK